MLNLEPVLIIVGTMDCITLMMPLAKRVFSGGNVSARTTALNGIVTWVKNVQLSFQACVQSDEKLFAA